ncbi:hypothetical protein [Pseudooceanicola sp.]|uniref:hypothetical protein n=1 Tax=Pseudooceanicola sp. TaxID=1914328 RepID=UPI00261138C7|nr:hypothetical protein [Pseudooceanicola sp.]MDF1857272.1 hypothetical protein [Pseudooceanicola sp.]
MTRFTLLAAAACLSLGASVAQAGPINRACLASDRSGASRAVCGCIQNAADKTLTRQDQRLAAKFFREPDKAEEVRMSKSNGNNAFWDRYTKFGAVAESSCS